ncbi:MAG: type VI secretion system membrane subunit TssM [Pseudomonadota bacterium]
MMLLNWLYEIRSYIGSYARYIRFPWLIPLIWLGALAALIWFYGETLALGTWHPLASPQVRLAAVVLLLLGYLIYLVRKLIGRRRADRTLIDAVTADGSVDPGRAAAEDVAELRSRLRTALKTLRKTLGRGSVYQLPWYVLIGSPGVGKTTALTNSGLNFPLADATGPHPVQGVAGTRYCDWWFTDEAILIDTAGRYTSQDGAQQVDKTAWMGFLKLLKRYRPRQPLNGAIVVLGLDDLVVAEPAERLRHGRMIRKRLRELDDSFRLRVPAYLVFTKADRLAGFSAFFESLDRTAREQVWGITLPLPKNSTEEAEMAETVKRGMDGLVERLDVQLLDRLQGELDSKRRAEIFAFPSQVALLIEPLRELIGEITAASRFDMPPRLRGIYFASARQDEAPVDLMTRVATANFGVDLPSLAEGSAPGQKSFFLARLLREVVLGEARLVSTDPRRERRSRIIRWTGVAALATAIIGLCGWWGADYLRQEDQLAATEAHLTVYAPAATQIPVKAVADRDFVKIAHVLDQARNISAPYAKIEKTRFALPSQRDKVLSGYSELYTRALNGFLLPRLLLQVESDMRAKPELASYVPDAVRIYPMLGSRTKMEPDFARKVLGEDMARVLPGDTNAEVRTALDRHVAALVAAPLTPIALDGQLIDEALANERARQLFLRWQAQGGTQCEAELEDHYPFSKHAVQNMSPKAFIALFGPDGVFDRFFRESLQADVDTSTTPWRWRQAGRVRAGLETFERAAAIRQAFFSGPDNSLSVAFDVTPISLDGDASSVVLTSEGQEVAYSQGMHDALRPVAFTWPGATGLSGAQIDFQPVATDSDVSASGFWALFRVLDAGEVRPRGERGVRVTFRSSGRSAVFDLRVESAGNPFDLATLRDFRCPRGF